MFSVERKDECLEVFSGQGIFLTHSLELCKKTLSKNLYSHIGESKNQILILDNYFLGIFSE